MLNVSLALENETNHFDRALVQIHRDSHKRLDERRKLALLKLYAKSTKPFQIKVGQILTNNSSSEEAPTIEGSKALLPNTLNLYKVPDVHQGGLGALCMNLHNGKIKTHLLSNLRRIGLED